MVIIVPVVLITQIYIILVAQVIYFILQAKQDGVCRQVLAVHVFNSDLIIAHQYLQI